MTVPATNWLDVTAIGRITAGQPYTPSVSGDVNGDGSRNDRAFIFAPDVSVTGDPAVAAAMTRLLANATGRAPDCLQSQIGTVASRNSCSTPWTPALDFQLNFKPAALGLDRRLTLSLQFQNALVGIDQLLHGQSNLHGWGQPVFPDRTLLFVRGFDPANNAFRYQVNEHFGVANGQNSAFRVPFQIGLQGRLSVGQDPSRQQVRQIFAGTDGKPPTREDYIARMSRLVPDPFLGTIALDDSLKLALTASQKTRLKALSDTLTPKTARITGEIADILVGAGSNPDPMVIFARMSGKTQDARKLMEQAIAELQTTLTPEQWAKLPESVKTVPSGRGFGGMGGGERRRGPCVRRSRRDSRGATFPALQRHAQHHSRRDGCVDRLARVGLAHQEGLDGRARRDRKAHTDAHFASIEHVVARVEREVEVGERLKVLSRYRHVPLEEGAALVARRPGAVDVAQLDARPLAELEPRAQLRRRGEARDVSVLHDPRCGDDLPQLDRRAHPREIQSAHAESLVPLGRPEGVGIEMLLREEREPRAVPARQGHEDLRAVLVRGALRERGAPCDDEEQ
jgi:hypothetical protein